MRQKVCMDVKTGIRDYWNRVAATYDKSPGIRNEQIKQAYRDVLGKALKGDKLNILDVGTGSGFLALLLAEAGHNVTALDLAEGVLRRWHVGYRKEIKKALSMRDGFTPQKAIGLFQQVGLSNILVENLREIREIQRNSNAIGYLVCLVLYYLLFTAPP